jgi:molybdopterin converting factor small subunit
VDVTVLLFALHRETFGARTVHLSLPAGATVHDRYEELVRRRPAMGDLRPYTSFAVNREWSAGDTILQNGDEVALLQPVSGGSHA